MKVWIIRNQFGRRNLNDMQRAEPALKLKPLLAAKAKENQGARNDIRQNSARSSESVATRDELARVAGVSHDTIDKVEKIVTSGVPELKEAGA